MRAEPDGETRPCGSAIYYLLASDEVSLRHRIDATQIWHHYNGAPLELHIIDPGGTSEKILTLGPKIDNGQLPQIVVPPLAWQEARTLGEYTLVGCTVSPAFEFSGFELADSGRVNRP
jgi:predicted cupin superfamily sugar epimerase